ncbi:hypothetical protein ASD11_14255 [Aeromicrobium sp. Root495]|uniref:hypothetical protein n=1 Tax=Aeromicrobium sp. Root495 TaxID=1736550 RepID=UPI0006F4ADCF|nr:hypothetical protein [Aeromicrobium sp. Root495]KQY55674.1 hypothetical protein ASD11_14255 [Aeromicrobium sp. Root495]
MTPTGILIEGTIDGQTDLLDRQVVTADGGLLAKVDDIELEEDGPDLVVSGCLVGPGALGPRLGGALGNLTVHAWSRLARRDGDDPRRIDYRHVRGIATVIAIDEDRSRVRLDGFETWARVRIIDALPGAGSDPDPDAEEGKVGELETDDEPGGPRHRFSRLAGMKVRFSDGSEGDQVTDVRMAKGPRRGHLPELRVERLIVGRNRPGTLFGYDRDKQRGPWIIQKVLGWVHRHTGWVRWSDVDSIDWDAGIVTLACAEIRPIDQN